MPPQEQSVLAGEHTAWLRLQAETVQEQTFEHQANPMSGAKPVPLGQGYRTIAWIPQTPGSWALPLLHERITSAETPIAKAATPQAQVCEKLTTRPVSCGDAEYGCAPFLLKTAELACDKLIRRRSNRVLHGAPPPYTGTGRPRKQGDKFQLHDPTSWWQPDEEQQLEDEKWG